MVGIGALSTDIDPTKTTRLPGRLNSPASSSTGVSSNVAAERLMTTVASVGIRARIS